MTVLRNAETRRDYDNGQDPIKDEEESAYNETFGPDDIEFSDSFTMVGPPFNYTIKDDPNNPIYYIGQMIERDGKIVKYIIDEKCLWEQLLRIMHHRIMVATGGSCLLNARTISRQITREGNIKSISAIERETVRLIRENFGVEDPQDPKEYRGLKKLRGTLSFWGTVGGKTRNNRKRIARVYQVNNGRKILKYIEEVINVGQSIPERK